MSIEFLFLNEPDMIECGVLDVKKCVETMDEVFRIMGKGDYLMGGPGENSHGVMLWFPQDKRSERMPIATTDRRYMTMPAYLGGRFNICGHKCYGSNIANKEIGLPRSILTVMLNDTDTGAPIALMSANLLSSMRTGSVPGVAVKYLQSSNASVVGIVGAGVISRSCLLAITQTLKNSREVRVYDIFPEKALSFSDEMKALTGIDIHPVDSLEKAVVGCDVVSVAASGIQPVLINDSWIKEGAVIIFNGAASLSEESYLNNKVVFDNWMMHKEWLTEMLQYPHTIGCVNAGHPSDQFLFMFNDGKIAEEDIISLGDIIENPSLGRKKDTDTFIFITGGMPLEDIAWGYEMYTVAKEKGIGQTLKIWDTPHWV